jgi:hypothetical protein
VVSPSRRGGGGEACLSPSSPPFPKGKRSLTVRFPADHPINESLAQSKSSLQSTLVNAEQATARQIEMYRAMTGEQRLEIALRLHELSCNIARHGIRQQHPHATNQDVERFLAERLTLAREL